MWGLTTSRCKAKEASGLSNTGRERDVHKNVIDGDMNDLDNVSDDTHDEETDSDRLRDLDKLPLVRY